MSEPATARFFDYSIERGVNPLWKAIALLCIGIVFGSAPTFVLLAYDHATELTMTQVDSEIADKQAVVNQKLIDMQSQLDSMSHKLDTLLSEDRRQH